MRCVSQKGLSTSPRGANFTDNIGVNARNLAFNTMGVVLRFSGVRQFGTAGVWVSMETACSASQPLGFGVRFLIGSVPSERNIGVVYDRIFSIHD